MNDKENNYIIEPEAIRDRQNALIQYISESLQLEYIDSSDNVVLDNILIDSTTIKTDQLIFKGNTFLWTRYDQDYVEFVICVKDEILDPFKEKMKHYIVGNNIITYDNLLHLTMIVKDAGAGFSEILKRNMPYIDRWTILDTGSTDNTIKDILNTLSLKEGFLEKGSIIPVTLSNGEVFKFKGGNEDGEDGKEIIDFAKTRNQCLNLMDKVEDKLNGPPCVYNVMLDDTYFLNGNVKKILSCYRCNKEVDSFHVFIKNNEGQYASNRICRNDKKLRYMFSIHEVIQNWNNKLVNLDSRLIYIWDDVTDYMKERTKERKKADVEILKIEMEKDPTQPRHLFYMAQTYISLQNWEKVIEYYHKRIGFDGNKSDSVAGNREEITEAYYNCALIGGHHLAWSWNECETYLKLCHDHEPRKPDALFYAGFHYLVEGKKENNKKLIRKGFHYLKKAFDIQNPDIFNLFIRDKDIYNYKLPMTLALDCCNDLEEYEVGYNACERFIKNNVLTPQSTQFDREIAIKMEGYYNIYNLLKMSKFYASIPGHKYNVNEKLIKLGKSQKPIIVFVAPGGWKDWNGESIYKEGVGGSETYIIEMARNLAKICGDKFDIYVFCRCESVNNNEVSDKIKKEVSGSHGIEKEIVEEEKKEEEPQSGEEKKEEDLEEPQGGKVVEIDVDGVHYRNIGYYVKFLKDYLIHAAIISRYAQYVPVTIQNGVTNIQFILHDLEHAGLITEDFNNVQISCMSPWHLNYYNEKYPPLKSITTWAPNGINISDFPDNDLKKEHFSFIYSSFPNRGLIHLLKLFPKIRERWPTSKLNIFCDLDHDYVKRVMKTEEITEMKNIIETHSYITNHGWVTKNELNKYWRKSHIWLYPCTFSETFCISALEAAASQTVAITTNLGALQNTVSNRGILINHQVVGSKQFEEEVFKSLTKIFNDKKFTNKLIRENRKWAETLDWCKLADKMYQDKISKLDYAGMLNWTVDIPVGTKEKFLNVLKYFENNNMACSSILEIGTYTGTSIIELLKIFPLAEGTVIDMWEDYDDDNEGDLLEYIEDKEIEGKFKTNCLIAEVEDRITVIKGDSKLELQKLIKNGKEYDFIYVDGSHKCLDCFADMVSGWSLLKKNGIMGVDDYLWGPKKNNTVLNKPFEAVNRFVKLYKKELKVIESHYRVFIEKIV